MMGRARNYTREDVLILISEIDELGASHLDNAQDYLMLTWQEKMQCMELFWRDLKVYREGNEEHVSLYSMALAQKRKRYGINAMPIFISAIDIKVYKDESGRWNFVNFAHICKSLHMTSASFEAYFYSLTDNEKRITNDLFRYYTYNRSKFEVMVKGFK